MAKEIDLKEGMFSIVKERRVLVAHCAMLKDGELIYAGRISDAPEPQAGWVMFLHPDDFEELDKFYRKEMN